MYSFNDFLLEQSFKGKVYHGTTFRFDQFDQKKARVYNDFYGGGTAYFTDSLKTGKSYATSVARKYKRDLKIVYECEVSFKNVFDVDHVFTDAELVKVLPDDVEQFARGAGLLRLGGDDKFTVISKLKSGDIKLTGKQFFNGLSGGMNASVKAREYIKKLGYDGLRYNGGEHMSVPKHSVYIAYDAKQIKIIQRYRLKK